MDDLRFSPIPIHAKRTATEPLVRDLNFDLKRPQKEHGGAPRPDSTGGRSLTSDRSPGDEPGA